MIKSIIFDMDGLMFDTEPMWDGFWIPTLEKQGLKLVHALILDTCGAAGSALPGILKKHYGDSIDIKKALADFNEIATNAFFSAPVPKKPYLDELIAYCKTKSMPIAIASSSDRTLVENNLKQHGMLELFDVLVCGGESPKSKPAPDIFLLAAEKLGVKPENCLVLEDSYNGIRGAAAGGFVTVMVPDTLPSNEEMEKLYTACYKNLAEVQIALEKGEIEI